MILIWRGAGLLALGLPLAGSLAAYLCVLGFATEGYLKDHHWPTALGLLLSAVAVFLIGHARDREEPGRDAFYFIPLKYWSFVIAPVAVGYLLSNPDPKDVKANSGPAPRQEPGASYSAPKPASQLAPGISLGNSGISYSGQKWPPDPKPQLQPRFEPASEASAGKTIVYTQYFANLKLEGIAYNPNGQSTAVLRGHRVKVGDQIFSYTVVSIQKNSVTLQAANGQRRVLAVGQTEDPL